MKLGDEAIGMPFWIPHVLVSDARKRCRGRWWPGFRVSHFVGCLVMFVGIHVW